MTQTGDNGKVHQGTQRGRGGTAGPRRLLPQHLADLRCSGLSDEQIEACGVYSEEDSGRVGRMLNWDGKAKGHGPFLVLPFPNPDGSPSDYSRLKPDRPRVDARGRPVKYESPRGLPNRAYFPPGFAQKWADPARPLVLTEGEKKAAKADQEGFLCLGLVGVWGWQKKRADGAGPREVLDELAALDWRGRKVHLTFDADPAERTRWDVRRAEWFLARALSALGAEVFAVRLPPGPAGPDGKPAKVGLDDFLVAEGPGGAAALRRLMAQARPPEKPPPRDGRRRVVLGTDEHRVVAEVTGILAEDPLLFQRGGRLVTPRVSEEADGQAGDRRGALKVQRPAGLTMLAPATAALVRYRVSAAISLVRRQGKGGRALGKCHCPEWLVPQVMAVPGKVRPVDGLLLGPTLRPDGGLVNAPGYDPALRLYLARALPGLEVPAGPTLEDARAAERALRHVVCDFPWETENDYAAWLALLLTAVCRHLIERTPLGLIQANVHGAGKSLLATIISWVAHGLSGPIILSWPEGSKFQGRGDEVRKRLASLLHQGASLVLIDNLPRGASFRSPELDAFLTSPAYYDRELGYNDGRLVGGPNHCLLLATGNNVTAGGDTADRTLPVVLRSEHPNPRARPASEFQIPDLEEYLAAHRPRLLGAALTVWRAWVLAGSPCPDGPDWGSFSQWVRTAVAAVRWLGLADPLANRVRKATDNDEELLALRALVAQWGCVLGHDFLTAGEIRDRLAAGLGGASVPTEVRAFCDALAVLCPPRPGKDHPLPDARALGRLLSAQARRCVDVPGEEDAEGKRGPARRYVIEVCEDTHLKVRAYRVAERAPPPPGAGLAGFAGKGAGQPGDPGGPPPGGADLRSTPPTPPTPQADGREVREV